MAMVLLIFLQIGLSGAALAQSGVVAWKEHQFHEDARAPAALFDRTKSSAEITWFYNHPWEMGFENHQFFKFLIFPQGLGVELAEPLQVAELRSHCKELQDFGKRFPNAAALLKPRLEAFKSMLRMYDSGKVLFNGNWMSQAEGQRLIEERNALIQAKRDLSDSKGSQSIHRIEVYVVGAVYLLVLLGFTLWRKRTPVLLLLVLPFIAGFGWMTYQERGLAWINRMTEDLREAYENFEWRSK